jgi:hypothetical protein
MTRQECILCLWHTLAMYRNTQADQIVFCGLQHHMQLNGFGHDFFFTVSCSHTKYFLLIHNPYVTTNL